MIDANSLATRRERDLMHRKPLTIDAWQVACFQSSAQDRQSVTKSWSDRPRREPYRSVSRDGQRPSKIVRLMTSVRATCGP
jgi:hypothetical protein